MKFKKTNIMSVLFFHTIKDYLKEAFNSNEYRAYENNDIEVTTIEKFMEDDNLGWSATIEGVTYYKVCIPSGMVEGINEDRYEVIYIENGEIKTN